MVDTLEAAHVAYRPAGRYQGTRSEGDIIKRLSGNDLTEGSCSSLALAYVGNKAGYDVLDFRDGQSRDFFASRSSVEKLAALPGVFAVTLTGRNDIASADQLLALMEPGKEYYLATGEHAAIVRKQDDGYEYLELQHPSDGNGWHGLNSNVLEKRFGCESAHLVSYANYLIEIGSLADNREFLSLLGYINTAEGEQRRGGAGHAG